MSDNVIPLLERALKSDSEDEAISCIRMARKKKMSLSDVNTISDLDFAAYIGKQVQVIDGKSITAWRAKAQHFENLLIRERKNNKSVDIELLNKVSALEDDISVETAKVEYLKNELNKFEFVSDKIKRLKFFLYFSVFFNISIFAVLVMSIQFS